MDLSATPKNIFMEAIKAQMRDEEAMEVDPTDKFNNPGPLWANTPPPEDQEEAMEIQVEDSVGQVEDSVGKYILIVVIPVSTGVTGREMKVPN